jgi:histone H3/H4
VKNTKNHLVVRFNLKKILPEDIRLGSKVADALDELIKKKIEKASERAKANKRTTILPQDL